MFDWNYAEWYVSEPRSIFARVAEYPDADVDVFVAIADDAEKATAIVNSHNAGLEKAPAANPPEGGQ